MNKKRMIRSAIIAVVALVFSAGLAAIQIKLAPRMLDQSAPRPAQSVAGTKIGGPFSLIDQNGQRVNESVLAGHYNLIYFGFTYCPAICPTELQKINVTLKQLGNLAEKIQPVFITIDPERDTPAIIKPYIAQFHPRMLGLTGTVDEVAAALKAYKVYARKVDDPGLSDYTMDHSSYIYFIAPDGTLIGMYPIDSTPSTMARDIEAALKI